MVRFLNEKKYFIRCVITFEIYLLMPLQSNQINSNKSENEFQSERHGSFIRIFSFENSSEKEKIIYVGESKQAIIKLQSNVCAMPRLDPAVKFSLLCFDQTSLQVPVCFRVLSITATTTTIPEIPVEFYNSKK